MIAALLLCASVIASLAAQPAAELCCEEKPIGLVDLFDHDGYRGFRFEMPIYHSEACYNIDCYNDRASSGVWKLPKDGDYDGTGYFVMYDGFNCTGTSLNFTTRDTDKVRDLGMVGPHALGNSVVTHPLAGLPTVHQRRLQVHHRRARKQRQQTVAVSVESISVAGGNEKAHLNTSIE